MGAKKTKKSKLGKIKSAIGGKLKGLVGKKGISGKRRRHGASWWANKVLVEKLKKRYWKIKFGGR